LLRFLAYEGSATLGAVELDQLAGDDVREMIGLVAQDAHIFDTTLANNLRIGRPGAPDGELLAALERVGLSEWANRLPKGLATELGERGMRVSGGERQRIAVARALLADFPVLVLDEPTEHLDTATADAITADLLAITAGRSTLLVTHRLLGLEEVDRIYVLDAGLVVEQGTHDELLAAGGRYAELWWRELRAGENLR
jgi:ATP-binding cassette subfamily C protein CydC